MAKKLGAMNADAEDQRINPKAEAEEAQRSNVTRETFLEAVRECAEIEARVKALRATRNGIRKKWKGNGIELGLMDAAIKMAEWDRDEVRANFDLRKRYAEWLGLPLGTQTDLFRGMDEEAVQRKEWRAVGRTYSRTLKPGRPPEECPPEFHQDFMAGFNEVDDKDWDEFAPDGGAPPVVDPDEPGDDTLTDDDRKAQTDAAAQIPADEPNVSQIKDALEKKAAKPGAKVGAKAIH